MAKSFSGSLGGRVLIASSHVPKGLNRVLEGLPLLQVAAIGCDHDVTLDAKMKSRDVV